MSTEETKKQVGAAMAIYLAVAEAIREAKQVPSGELYAMLMGKMSIETYEGMIQSLINVQLIRRDRSHMLVWTGPEVRK